MHLRYGQAQEQESPPAFTSLSPHLHTNILSQASSAYITSRTKTISHPSLSRTLGLPSTTTTKRSTCSRLSDGKRPTTPTSSSAPASSTRSMPWVRHDTTMEQGCAKVIIDREGWKPGLRLPQRIPLDLPASDPPHTQLPPGQVPGACVFSAGMDHALRVVRVVGQLGMTYGGPVLEALDPTKSQCAGRSLMLAISVSPGTDRYGVNKRTSST